MVTIWTYLETYQKTLIWVKCHHGNSNWPIGLTTRIRTQPSGPIYGPEHMQLRVISTYKLKCTFDIPIICSFPFWFVFKYIVFNIFLCVAFWITRIMVGATNGTPLVLRSSRWVDISCPIPIKTISSWPPRSETQLAKMKWCISQ